MSKKRRRLIEKERKRQALAGRFQPDQHDPFVELLSKRFVRGVRIVADRGRVNESDVRKAAECVETWEAKHGTWPTEEVGRKAVADITLHVIKLVAADAIREGREWTNEARDDLVEIIGNIFGYKSELARAAGIAALPEGQRAVTTYLQCEKALFEATSNMDEAIRNLNPRDRDRVEQLLSTLDEDERGRQEGLRIARGIWARLRNTRVFEFPTETWTALHRGVERAVATWYDEHADRLFGDEVEGVVDRMRFVGRDMPFPSKLPFETSYIGIGAGVVLDDEWARARVILHSESDGQRFVGAVLLGYLICEAEQQVYEMIHIYMDDDDYILPLAQRYGTVWGAGETLGPWLVHGLVDAINEHNTVVLNHRPDLRMKRESKTSGRNARGFLPKPYYTLRMRHKVIDELSIGLPTGSGSERTLSRRYDRRGHERVRVHRGLLPIDPKEEEKLLKYGYRFIVGRPSAEDAERLAYRELPPKRSDEWMAIKVSWIDDTVVGSESLPYIPAVRVPAKRKAS